jgi:uncharacterized membrane protein
MSSQNQFLQWEDTLDPSLSPGVNQQVNVSNFERGLSILIGAWMLYRGIKKLRKAPLSNLIKASSGAGLLFRGISGYCPVYNHFEIDGNKTTSVNIRTTIVVNKPRNEVYAFWRKLENLPLFMRHLESVTELDNKRSHWEAKIPSDLVTIKWDAEIVKDDENSLLSWQSLPGSTIENAGKVEFRNALGDRGTELRIMITYRPPAGNLGTQVARLFNGMFEKMVKEDVTNFKQFIELKESLAVPERQQTSNISNFP